MMLVTDDFALFASSLKLETEALEKSNDCEGRGLKHRPPVTPPPPEQNTGEHTRKPLSRRRLSHTQPPKSCKCVLYVECICSDLCEIQYVTETSTKLLCRL